MEATRESTPLRLSPGGMALDLRGEPADMPREQVSELSHQLLDIVALLHVVRGEVQAADGDWDKADADNLTCPQSRAVALTTIAEQKARDILKAIAPYN